MINLDTARWNSILYELIPCINKVLLLLLLLLSFSLGNFKYEEVGLTIEIGSREVAFNLRNYIETYKAKTVQLYLRSKRNNTDCEPLYADDACDSDDDLIPMWEPRELALLGSSSERNSAQRFWMVS